MSSTLVNEDNRTRSSGGRPSVVQLSARGVSVILALPEDQLPIVLHWGARLGSMDPTTLAQFEASSLAPLATNGVDQRVRVALLPEGWTGWTGTPGLAGHRNGACWSPKFVPQSVRIESVPDHGGVVEVVGVDLEAQLALELTVQLLPSGLLRLRGALINTGETPYDLESLTLAIPVPTEANELHDLAGRWAKERMPQVRPFTVGAHLREGRHGRTGADAATLLIAGQDGLDFDRGEAWGVHVAFSGNHRVMAERTFSGERVLSGGELLLPGEVSLAGGERYEAPWLYASYGTGFDGVAARFHEHLRLRSAHPRTPRPVVMNVWEAVYFEHDLERILPLVDLAAAVGVERFVLDDGWFGARRDDTAGLGDWRLSEEVWGGGRFAALIERIKSRGMSFGLWFEPEMINLDSDLARAHPEWILQVPGRLPVPARNQQVLDLTHPGAYEHIRDSIVTLVHEYGIEYIKWDHNRDLVDAGSTRTGRAGVHLQTLAVYRLLDDIRSACPGLEIESCSSGGARVDLEILEHTDRVWASDTIDPHERHDIQRWTAQLLPPELVGSHVGAEKSHTTGRRSDLSFRAITALFGHFGIEWDLTQATTDELSELAEWVSYYKSIRDLVHSGEVVRRSLEGGDLWLHGSVRSDGSEGLYSLTLRSRHITWPVGRVRLPGLNPSSRYRLTAAGPGQPGAFSPRTHPAWWQEGLVLGGDVITTVGVQIPALDPDTAVLLHATELENEDRR